MSGFDVYEVGLSQYRDWLANGGMLYACSCDVTCGYVVVFMSSSFGRYFGSSVRNVVKPRAIRYFLDEVSAKRYVADSIADDLEYINFWGGHIAYEYEIWHIVEDSPETVFSDPVVDSLKIVPCKKRDFLFYASFGSMRVPEFLHPERHRYCLVSNDLDGSRTVYCCADDISVLVSLRTLLIDIDRFYLDGLCGDYSVYRLDD